MIQSRGDHTQQEMLLDIAGVHHDSDPLTHGLGRQIPPELCSHRSSVAVSPGHLPPDHSQPGLGVAPGHTGLVLTLVHIGTPLTNIPPEQYSLIS